MEIGDLSGWLAALIAVGAMCVAIWNASSAEKQAQFAQQQADEAKRSRETAEKQTEIMSKQYEDATRQQLEASEQEAYEAAIKFSTSLRDQSELLRRSADLIRTTRRGISAQMTLGQLSESHQAMIGEATMFARIGTPLPYAQQVLDEVNAAVREAASLDTEVPDPDELDELAAKYRAAANSISDLLLSAGGGDAGPPPDSH